MGQDASEEAASTENPASSTAVSEEEKTASTGDRRTQVMQQLKATKDLRKNMKR